MDRLQQLGVMEFLGCKTEKWAPRMRLYFGVLTQRSYGRLYQLGGSGPYQRFAIEMSDDNEPSGFLLSILSGRNELDQYGEPSDEKEKEEGLVGNVAFNKSLIC